ncbi:U5-like protein [Lissonota sp. PSUC_FEM 10030012]|nr:U5-like protein [Lissonota sp. PSUC_FEM 10030012]
MLRTILSGVCGYALTYFFASRNREQKVGELEVAIRSVEVSFYRRHTGKSALIIWDDHQCAVWHANKLFVYDYWNHEHIGSSEHSGTTDFPIMHATEIVLAYDFHEKSKYLQHDFPNEMLLRELFEVEYSALQPTATILEDGMPLLYKKQYMITDDLNIISVVFDALSSGILRS